MHALLASVACSVAVSILLKLAHRHKLHIGQAIAFNYIIAAGLCLLLLQPHPRSLLTPSTPWWVLIALGILLPTVFLAMAGAVRHAGIVLSDAAQRLSLFIPLIAAFLLFGEQVSTGKLAGIGIALLALACLLWQRPQDSTTKQHQGVNIFSPFIWLLCVWLGYGAIDILFKQLAKSGTLFSNSLFTTFTLATIMMFAVLFFQHSQWQVRNVVAGLILGLLNFSNIYFYIRAHQLFPDNPTLVFSTMNIGVIALGTFVGAGLFKEKITWVNTLGVALAITAIVVLLPGQ